MQQELDFSRAGWRRWVIDRGDFRGLGVKPTNCILLLGAMESFGQTCWASIESLSKRSSMSQRTIKRTIAALIAADLLGVDRRAGQKTNAYCIDWQRIADRKFVESVGPKCGANLVESVGPKCGANLVESVGPKLQSVGPKLQKCGAMVAPKVTNEVTKKKQQQQETQQVVVVSSLDWETQRAAYHAAIDRAFDQAEGQGRAPGDILLRITINGAGNDPVAPNAKPGPSMGAESIEQVNPVDPWDAVRVALKAANVGQWIYALNAARSQGATVDQCLRAIGSSTEPGVIYNRMVQGCVETVQQSTERVRRMPNRERIRTALYAQWRLLPDEQRTSEALENATERAYAKAMAQYVGSLEVSPHAGGQVE